MTACTEDNMIITREPKTFHFDFNIPRNVDKNLKHEIEFIIKHNESLAEYIIKNDIDQLKQKTAKPTSHTNLFFSCNEDLKKD